MAMPPLGFNWDDLKGEFRHRETRKDFHYRMAGERPMAFVEYPHEIFVGPDDQTRYARVLATVAYVVVDEAADGSPVVEKWPTRRLWARD